MKRKITKILLLILFTIILNTSNVEAYEDGLYDGAGVSSAQSGGGAHVINTSWAFAYGSGIRFTLIKVDGNTPKLVSFFDMFYVGAPFKSDANLFSSSNYTVVGLIDGNYDYKDNHPGRYFTTSERWFLSKSFSSSNYSGYVIDQERIKSRFLEGNDHLTFSFFWILEQLLAKGAKGTNDSLIPEIDVDLSSASTGALALQNAYEEDIGPKKTHHLSNLSKYRVVVEPLYKFDANNYTEHMWITTKTMSYLHNPYGKTNATVKGLPYPTNGVQGYLTNFKACDYVHGSINNTSITNNSCLNGANNNRDSMHDVNSGLGYVIFKIVDDHVGCDPKTSCCYDKNGKYNSSYSGTSQHYRCPLNNLKEGTDCPFNPIDEEYNCQPKAGCPDKTNNADCYANGNTQMSFHENDNLQKCTLDKTLATGFTIIQDSQTNGYCEVACKDDYDAYLPTDKQAASGRYFTLDLKNLNSSFPSEMEKIVPKVTAKRTCVTSKIDYNKFNNDLKDHEDKKLIPDYNNWKDNVYIMDNVTGTSWSVSGSCEEQVDENTYFTCSYTGEAWRTFNQPAYNYKSNDYYAESGVKWYNSCSCGPHGGITLDEKLSQLRSHYRSQAINYMNKYRGDLGTYQNMINNYNKCFSWTDTTNNIKYISSNSDIHGKIDYSMDGNFNEREKYRFTFYPDVTFTYDDKDSYGLGGTVSYKFENGDIEYSKDLNRNSVSTKTGGSFRPELDVNTTYWPKGSTTNAEYTSGGSSGGSGEVQKGLYYETRLLYNCSGNNCGKSDRRYTAPTQSNFFYTSSYIKQTEKVSYDYYLPRVSTNIPNGRLNSLGSHKNYNSTPTDKELILETEAVPVNINTVKGTYYYYLTVKNLKDDTRKNAVNRTIDNVEDRFKSSKAMKGIQEYKTGMQNDKIDGSSYICEYEVINEIYDPVGKKTKFFYRPIDLGDINPNDRTIGYNWNPEYNNYASNAIESMKESSESLQTLTKQKDKFEFVLTPQVMRSIREYNKSLDEGYSDWDMKCTLPNEDEKYYCESQFLTCITNGGYRSDPYSCNINRNILLDGVTVDNSKYNLSDLNANRSILKSKIGVGG